MDQMQASLVWQLGVSHDTQQQLSASNGLPPLFTQSAAGLDAQTGESDST